MADSECNCETEQTVTDKSVLMAAHRTVCHHPAAEEKGARHGAPLHPSRQRQGHTGRSKWKNSCFLLVSLDCSAWTRGLLVLRASPSVHSAPLPTHLVKYPEWESLKRCCQRGHGGDLSQRERSSLWRIGQEGEECRPCREVLKALVLTPKKAAPPFPQDNWKQPFLWIAALG